MTLKPLVHENGNGTKPNWAPIQGLWETSGEVQVYRGGPVAAKGPSRGFPLGLAVSEAAMENGECEVGIRFSSPFGDQEQAAGVIIGFGSIERGYVYAELGAGQSSYVLGEYANGFWRPLVPPAGQRQNLKNDRDYVLRLKLIGQKLSMSVDGVPVLQCLLPHPLDGRQVGLIATGDQEITFSQFKVISSRPRAFVVMQFAEPYHTFYRDVIQEQAVAAGFDVFRIDEKAGPGIIIEDIQREIEQSALVIAEITPSNPNVFYEVGYAHALRKPTILLAQRDSKPPFDVSSFRVVFYNDTIGGKAEVERSLRTHLEAVAGR
jgi:hypothetical protein